MSSDQAARTAPSSSPAAGTGYRDWGIGAALAGAAALVSLSVVSLGAFFAAVFSVVAFPFARVGLILYLSLVLGFSVVLSDIPISFGSFKLYGADSLILLLLYAAIYGFIQVWRGEWKWSESEKWLTGLLAISCGYGLVLLVYSLSVKGYPYDKVFGDYRRMYFYACAFVLPLWIPLRRIHLSKVKYALLLAGVFMTIIASWRIAMQQPIRLDENLATGYTGQRMLAVTEFSACALVLAYSTAVVRLRARWIVKSVAIALAGAMVAAMALSGFRLALVFIVFAPALSILLVTWARRESMWILARTAALAGLAAVPVAVAAGFAFQNQFEKMIQDLEVRNMDAQVTGDYRQWTWRQAMADFRESPVIGAGLGHELTFLNRTRAGMFEIRKASAHSLLVSVLYQTGLVGAGIFIAYNGLFVIYFLRRLRAVPFEYHAVICALFTGYVCLTLASFSQPLRVAGYISIALTMGFVCRLLRETRIESPNAVLDPAQ